MKYQRLSKEQLEELHQEFINFLATQSITGKEWANIKENQPEVAEQELDVFSDLIWEGVLNKTEYVDHISPHQMNLFCLGDDVMKLISVRTTKVDLTTAEGMKWVQANVNEDEVELFTAQKNYGNEPNTDKFKLIQKGAFISKGEWYNNLDKFINKK